jgi:hypothetical protein
VLARTGKPGTGIDNRRRQITVGKVSPRGIRNERPDRVLSFDDDIRDDVGPFPARRQLNLPQQ